MKEKVLSKFKKKKTELEQKIKLKHNQHSLRQVLKSTWENFIENFVLSLLIKHQ